MKKNEQEYLKMLQANYEEALKLLIATSKDECVDLLELQVRDYVKSLEEISRAILNSGGSNITIKDEILNPNKQ